MKYYKYVIFIMVGFILCSCANSILSQQKSKNGGDDPKNEVIYKECLEEARKQLGPNAEIVKYGILNSTGFIEAVAVIKKRKPIKNHDEMIISQLVVIGRVESHWMIFLSAFREIKNSEGYIGLDYIDETSDYHGYRLKLSDPRMDGPDFTIMLTYITKEGEDEGLPIDISWNNKVGRYQEYLGDEFKAELKNPPHKIHQ